MHEILTSSFIISYKFDNVNVMLSCNFMVYVSYVIPIDKDFVTTLDIKQTMEEALKDISVADISSITRAYVVPINIVKMTLTICSLCLKWQKGFHHFLLYILFIS